MSAVRKAAARMTNVTERGGVDRDFKEIDG